MHIRFLSLLLLLASNTQATALATTEETKQLVTDITQAGKIIAGTCLTAISCDFFLNGLNYSYFFAHGYNGDQSLIGNTRALYKIAFPGSILLVAASRLGSSPKITADKLSKLGVKYTLGVYVSTILAAAWGYQKGLEISENKNHTMNEADAAMCPAFYADLYARNMCYLSGTISVYALATDILCKRYKAQKEQRTRTK